MDRNHYSHHLLRASLLAAGLGLAALAFSQWSTDPAVPLMVSPATGTPTGLKAMSDGAGGYYAFWCDKRTDGTLYDVFGQHLDAEGNALWAADGALIHHEEGNSIGDYTVVRLGSGNLMLVTIAGPATFTDTMRAMLLDEDAQPLWEVPVNITGEGSPILGLGDLRSIPTSDGAIIGWYDTYFGGSNGVNVTRITEEGEVLWAENGYAIPGAAYGPFDLLPDGADGVIVNWRSGNGIGAGYGCMRVDSTGTNAWDANVVPNAGGQGFGGNHKVAQGEDASMLLTYADAQNKVMLAQLDTTGTLHFDPSSIAVCGFASNQGQVSMLHANGITTVIWGDSRAPAANHDVYMQRFDSDGGMLLDPDGELVMHLNTYIPNTGLVHSLNGSIIATIDGTVPGYSAMRMNADGTGAWPTPVAFCTATLNPFYEQQFQLSDGEGGIVSVWQTFSGSVLAARIYANGELGNHVGIEEAGSRPTLHLHPNPANDRITINLPGNVQVNSVEVLDAQGHVVLSLAQRSTPATINVAALPPGYYHATISTAHDRYMARFAKQ